MITRAAPRHKDALAAHHIEQIGGGILDQADLLALAASSHLPHSTAETFTIKDWSAVPPGILTPPPYAYLSNNTMGRSASSNEQQIFRFGPPTVNGPFLPVLYLQKIRSIVKGRVYPTSRPHPHFTEDVRITPPINSDEGNVCQSLFPELRSSRVPPR